MRRATRIGALAGLALLAVLGVGGSLVLNAQGYKVAPVSESYARSLLAKAFDGAFADAPLHAGLQRRSLMAPDGEYLIPLDHVDLPDHVTLADIDPAARNTLMRIASTFPTAHVATDVIGVAISETAGPTAILTLFVAADGTGFIHAGDL